MPVEYVEVAIPLNVHQTFTYRVPESLTGMVRRGCRVVVPFGRQTLTGYIVEEHESLAETGQEGIELKEIEELLETEPVLDELMLNLTKWIADYYYAAWGEVIRSSLPTGINVEAEVVVTVTAEGLAAWEATGRQRTGSSSKWRIMGGLIAQSGGSSEVRLSDLAREFGRERTAAAVRELERSGLVRTGRQRVEPLVKVKRQQAVRLVEPVPDSSGKGLNEPQERLLQALREAGGPMALAELIVRAEISPSVARTLEKRGYIEIFTREVRRDPLAHLAAAGEGSTSEEQRLDLTVQQQAALEAITAGIEQGGYAAFLLHGVTGSGKTEVYIRAMHEALRRGRSALMLVPEISLTPMFARRLKAHFGEAVAILHSSLSEGERLDEWNRIRRGEARICIGARSGVFAPMRDLGLIVVDEEHEASYKQDETPRYHGRDSAIMRASQTGAVVVLGSATPSMESYHNAHTGKYRYLRLDERIGGRQLAQVEMVDMRQVFTRHGKQQIFSDEMKQAIVETAERGEQTMVLLNRRGFSSFTLCRSCGHTANCPNCDVTLTFHRDEGRLICHYCNHQQRVHRICPECNGQFIYYVGEGTEQIEALLKDLYPSLRIARLDRDTTRRRGAFERVLGEFASGEVDLLVGTQMIAKGHDFHNVTLVCVISVDAGLGMPDFRAAERTFQLLTQVAGRAGRGDKAGRVLIQSYHPEHYALQFAAEQNYEKFYRHEIHYRREMRYPPFALLINILIRHGEFARAAATAGELVRLLKLADREKLMRIMGPAPAPVARIKGEHRLQVLIKTGNRRHAREALDTALTALKESGHDLKSINIDMDPISLM